MNILKVKDLSTNEIYFVKTGCRRTIESIPSDFISIGEQIKITGVKLHITSNDLVDRPISSIIGNVDGVLLGISIENSSGQVYQPFHGPMLGGHPGRRHNRFGFHP